MMQAVNMITWRTFSWTVWKPRTQTTSCNKVHNCTRTKNNNYNHLMATMPVNQLLRTAWFHSSLTVCVPLITAT